MIKATARSAPDRQEEISRLVSGAAEKCMLGCSVMGAPGSIDAFLPWQDPQENTSLDLLPGTPRTALASWFCSTLLPISFSLLYYFPVLSTPTYLIFHFTPFFRAIPCQPQLLFRAFSLGPRGWAVLPSCCSAELPFFCLTDEECQLQPRSLHSGIWDQSKGWHDGGDGTSAAGAHLAVRRPGEQGQGQTTSLGHMAGRLGCIAWDFCSPTHLALLRLTWAPPLPIPRTGPLPHQIRVSGTCEGNSSTMGLRSKSGPSPASHPKSSVEKRCSSKEGWVCGWNGGKDPRAAYLPLTSGGQNLICSLLFLWLVTLPPYAIWLRLLSVPSLSVCGQESWWGAISVSEMMTSGHESLKGGLNYFIVIIINTDSK